jgi:hypothetical protein
LYLGHILFLAFSPPPPPRSTYSVRGRKGGMSRTAGLGRLWAKRIQLAKNATPAIGPPHPPAEAALSAGQPTTKGRESTFNAHEY